MGKVRQYLRYQMEIAKIAWKRSWDSFKPDEHAKRDVFVFGIGAVLRLVVSGEDVALDDVFAALFYGVFALVAALVLAIVWNRCATPYRLNVEHRAKIRRYENQIRGLESALERRVNFETLGRNMRRLVDDATAMLSTGHVDGRDFDTWMGRASELAGCFNEGEKHMLQTRTFEGRNYFANHHAMLVDNVGKLRLIMGRVFEAAERVPSETKELKA